LTLEGVTAHGNTDVGILRDAFRLAGIQESVWRPQLETIKEALCRFVEERREEICVTVMPQVQDILQHLKDRGATLGVATGNLERIGKIKLGRAGLLDYFDFGAWSDEFEFRADVIASAICKAHNMAGERATICVVGDTPSDIQAARRNLVPVIAVATGIYPFEELERAQPDLCIHSFSELLCAV
jgi:phosphoglycolate phosphatase-like HAD superfamily hydrolase